MAYATDHLEFARYYDPAARKAGHRGLLRRAYDALHASRQRQADRDIAAYVERSGGRLSDSIERELMDRVMRGTLGEWRR
jgi:hypothetical protein